VDVSVGPMEITKAEEWVEIVEHVLLEDTIDGNSNALHRIVRNHIGDT
jgi:hypothetical protein